MNGPRNLTQDFFDMLMESQYWSPATLVTYQREQLEQLLRHARRNVPFYETRLDPVFRAGGGIDWSRWSEVPIVTRADMSENRITMLARELPKGHGRVGTTSTSGSTGLPVEISSNRLTAVAANANRWRAHCWHDLDWSRTYTARHSLEPEADWPHGRLIGRWGPAWNEAARKGRAFILSRSATMEQTLEFLGRSESAYFSAGPKTAHVLAVEAERLGISITLDCILTHGERVDDADREAVKRIFKARMLEHYGSKEGGQIAYSCPSGRGLHVNAESVLVEIVDAEGRPCAPGVSGRVIVTPFVSTAQPLIRYDQGDRARLGQPCRCGRNLLLLEEIEGRTTVIFSHPDGRKVARMLNNEAREALRCTFWQIAQTGPLQFEVRYVPEQGTSADEAAAQAVFRSVYFDDAEVRFVRTEHLPLTAAGKFVEYVVEWLGPQT
jgi:phenylacetate-CoA ligase